ncbi:response regulator [Magnetospirillum molischianum]|uniref:Two-component response transcriptional regulator rcp1 n=1 Tax=Magnetospirillum molischianum DSM 120 TaxID=1150626 RepID=H8FV37_MAGML|nr:response regulator [Magnetospirillum molischianum]CCG42225.1 Two-component response transcriptional regulator rcp1 [Magnetospirillum molischianum DSM 120]
MSSQYVVLIVDDDPGDAGLVKAAFSIGRYPCRLDHVTDGMAAMEFLRDGTSGKNGTLRPDLILLDINMPRKDGHAVLTEVKADARLRDIPVVMLTTSDAERDIATAYRAGASGYVTKPVDVDALFSAVQGIQEYWFGVMRLPGHRP